MEPSGFSNVERKVAMIAKCVEFINHWGRRLFVWETYLHTGNIRDHQVRRMNDIITNARRFSPFYADLYKDIPQDFQLITVNDIHKLPVVKKQSFKKACSQDLLVCENLDKRNLISASTTGSTGTPMKVFFTENGVLSRRKVKARVFHDAGVRKYDRYCMIWRQKSQSKSSLFREKNGLLLSLNVGEVVNPMGSSLTYEKLRSSVNSIIDFDPQLIHGYVSALFVISTYLKKNNLRLPALKRVVAAAEYLPQNVWDILEESFGCPVINFYGSSEADAIACSSINSRKMTISEDLYFTEVLNENDEPVAPGEPGLITLTNLTAKAMPFIRFQIGDMAIVDDNFYNYDEEFRYFLSVEGRTNDVFELKDGSIIFSHLWHILFRDHLWIERFQVIQRSTSRIEIKILPLTNDEEAFSTLKKSIMEKFNGINFDFRIVNRLEFGKGDKFRAVVSDVQNKFNRINKNN